MSVTARELLKVRADGAVLVTGTSSGIGESCAIALDALGYTVFAGVRDPDDGVRLQKKCSDRLIPLMLDITSDEQIFAATKFVASQLPRSGLIAIINNAGISVTGPLECIGLSAIKKQFDVNVFGCIAVIQSFLPLLRQSKGRIINIGSTSGRIPGIYNGPYCASKSALESLTYILRMELQSAGIRVSLIEPGVVTTPFWEKLDMWESKLVKELKLVANNPYYLALEHRKRRLQTVSEHGQSPTMVCKAIITAISATHPKARYTVGRDAKLKTWLWKMMPEWVQLKVLERKARQYVSR